MAGRLRELPFQRAARYHRGTRTLKKFSMTTLEVTLSLPDSLAAEAREAGLLSPIELERLVREALRAGQAD